ncbi:hypothetical protein IIB34_06505, partial [PVC group bacterium]|nr:hypothetical protein [PVC group bacterium]
MKAHIWLGLLILPLAILHSGFRWGGMLSATLMVLLLPVYFSGVFGLVMQRFVPQRMIEETPHGTVVSEIERVIESLRREARQVVSTVCTAADVMEAEHSFVPNWRRP